MIFKQKSLKSFDSRLSIKGSGSKTRTYDLRVMSPTSYQLLHPALFWCLYDSLHYCKKGFLSGANPVTIPEGIKKVFRLTTKDFLKGSGSRTRTYDLRVMSPTSYQLLHPALFFGILTFRHNFRKLFSIIKNAICTPF
jgi:hypothetical protein